MPLATTAVTGLFQEVISDLTFQDMYRRDSVAHGSINKVARNLFDKWCECEILFRDGKINDSATKSLQDFNTRWNVKSVFKKWWLPKEVLGVALLLLGLPGELGKAAVSGPLTWMMVVPKSRINGFFIDVNRKSRTFGEIVGAQIIVSDQSLGAEVGFEVGYLDKYINVHASRFVHWHYPQLEDLDPWGMSGWLPFHPFP